MFKYGNEQHNPETQKDPSILQEEIPPTAASVITSIIVQHLRHLKEANTTVQISEVQMNSRRICRAVLLGAG